MVVEFEDVIDRFLRSKIRLADLRESELRSFIELHPFKQVHKMPDGKEKSELFCRMIEADRELGNIYAYKKGLQAIREFRNL